MTTPPGYDTIALEVIARASAFHPAAAADGTVQRSAPLQIILPRPGFVRGFSFPRFEREPRRPAHRNRPAPAGCTPAPPATVCARSGAPWAHSRRAEHTAAIRRAAHNAVKTRCERFLYSAYILQGKHISAHPAPLWSATRRDMRRPSPHPHQPARPSRPRFAQEARPKPCRTLAPIPGGF